MLFAFCGYTQGRNVNSSHFVAYGPCLSQGKKLWYILRVYLDTETVSYCCSFVKKKKVMLFTFFQLLFYSVCTDI